MSIFKTVSYKNAPLLLKWMCFFKYVMFMLPVIVLIYQDKGLSLGDFFLLQGIFSIATVILEIPTGYIGDLFSRKKVISLSIVAWLLAHIVLYSAYGFWDIILVEILCGFASSLYSGTYQAYLYDVLKKENQEKHYMKQQGSIESIGILSTAITTLFGGLLYAMGADLPIIGGIIFISVSLIISLFLPDMQDIKRVVEKGKSKWKDIMGIAKYAITHTEIKWLIIYPAIFGTGTLILMWIQQPIMKANLVPLYLFGFFIGASQLFRSLSAKFAHNVFNKLKTKNYTVALFGLLFVGFVAGLLATTFTNIYLTYVLCLILGVMSSSQVSLKIVAHSMINHRIKSDERATVLSVSSMGDKISRTVFLISMKFLIDGYSMQVMLWVLAPIILLLTFISMAKLLKLKI